MFALEPYQASIKSSESAWLFQSAPTLGTSHRPVLRKFTHSIQPASSIDSRPRCSHNGPVEQRSESRVRSNEPLRITALQSDDAICTGRFVDLSSDGMRIISNADLEIGSLLRLDIGDDLMVAEVRHCEADEGEFAAGLLILSWLEKSELKRLLREAVVGPTLQRVRDDSLLAVV